MTTIAASTNAYGKHPTWNCGKSTPNVLVDTLEEAQRNARVSTLCEYNDSGIPFYRISNVEDLESNPALMEDIYQQFFESGGSGCLGFKNVFEKSTMVDYNEFCEKYIATDAKYHSNCRHPKQLGKYVINNLMEALSEQNPNLLLQSQRISRLTEKLVM